jgi:DedD protein
MDLSLKQRLLGAAVLIALAVIFVPMFMSGSAPETPPGMETSNLAIPPAPEREFQSRVLPVDAGTPEGSATGEAFPTAGVDAASASAPETAPQPAMPEPAPASTVPVATASAPAAAPAADAAPTTTTAPAAGRAADGRFFVHLGVYAETKNADDLTAALKKAGYPAFAEASEFRGKPAARVRVGPYADRAAAESARLRIKDIKPAVPGSVVQLAVDMTADAPAAALPANRAGGWGVQLSALKEAADANRLRDRLRAAGYTAFVDKVDADGATLWRVRAGPEVDRAAAERLRDDIRARMKLEGILVTL